MIELVLVITVLVVAFLAFSQSLVASMSLTRVNRETALATDAIRQEVELLQGAEAFDQIWFRYNADPGDDPATGASPGSSFSVEGLQALDDDPDGKAGELVFPDVESASGLVLREDLDMPELGLPRDLNGDGLIDSDDRSGDYRLLPVVIRIRWKGASGERTAEVRTLLADR